MVTGSHTVGDCFPVDLPKVSHRLLELVVLLGTPALGAGIIVTLIEIVLIRYTCFIIGMLWKEALVRKPLGFDRRFQYIYIYIYMYQRVLYV